MKKKIKNYIIIILLSIILIATILNSNIIIESSKEALSLWKNNIFPALFTIFIITDLLLNYEFINIISKIFYKPFYYLFRFNKNELFIFLISILGGFPSSSKYTSKLYKNNEISLDNANRMLMCSHFSNPLFIFGTILSLIQDKKICILILISHYLGNFVLAFYTREYQEYDKYYRKAKNKDSFFDVITTSITENINTLLFILGSITIFFCLSDLIVYIFSFNSLSDTLISGLLEITQGIKKASILDTSINIKAIITTFFISFGGLCVHLQTLGMIQGTKLSYKSFLKGRVIHSTLSVIFFIILYKLSI